MIHFDPELLKHLVIFGTAFSGPFTAAFQHSTDVANWQPPIIPLEQPPIGKVYGRLNLDFTDAAWQVPPPNIIPPPPATGAIFMSGMSKIQQTL